MRLVSVNISPLKTVERSSKTWTTGIFKQPVTGTLAVGLLGLQGDEQGDKKHHGGPDMALYAYTADNYDFWRNEIPDMPYGKLGENLTIAGLDEADVCIGDRFRIGEAVEVEVSVPRAPCSTLAMAMEDVAFPKRFLASGRVGFYLRVLRTGSIRVGDELERTHLHPARLGIAEVTRLMYFDKENRDGVARAAAVSALSQKWRDRFTEMLAKS